MITEPNACGSVLSQQQRHDLVYAMHTDVTHKEGYATMLRYIFDTCTLPTVKTCMWSTYANGTQRRIARELAISLSKLIIDVQPGWQRGDNVIEDGNKSYLVIILDNAMNTIFGIPHLHMPVPRFLDGSSEHSTENDAWPIFLEVYVHIASWKNGEGVRHEIASTWHNPLANANTGRLMNVDHITAMHMLVAAALNSNVFWNVTHSAFPYGGHPMWMISIHMECGDRGSQHHLHGLSEFIVCCVIPAISLISRDANNVQSVNNILGMLSRTVSSQIEYAVMSTMLIDMDQRAMWLLNEKSSSSCRLMIPNAHYLDLKNVVVYGYGHRSSTIIAMPLVTMMLHDNYARTCSGNLSSSALFNASFMKNLIVGLGNLICEVYPNPQDSPLYLRGPYDSYSVGKLIRYYKQYKTAMSQGLHKVTPNINRESCSEETNHIKAEANTCSICFSGIADDSPAYSFDPCRHESSPYYCIDCVYYLLSQKGCNETHHLRFYLECPQCRSPVHKCTVNAVGRGMGFEDICGSSKIAAHLLGTKEDVLSDKSGQFSGLLFNNRHWDLGENHNNWQRWRLSTFRGKVRQLARIASCVCRQEKYYELRNLHTSILSNAHTMLVGDIAYIASIMTEQQIGAFIRAVLVNYLRNNKLHLIAKLPTMDYRMPGNILRHIIKKTGNHLATTTTGTLLEYTPPNFDYLLNANEAEVSEI